MIILKKQQIVYKGLNEIKPYEKNAKKHSKEQIKRIEKSIKELGFRGAILIDKDNVVIAGHGRCLAAKKLGMKEVPCIYVDDLSEEQIKALRLIDNKVSESEWDEELLGQELEGILNIDMDDFGFNIFSKDEEEEKIYTQKTGVPQYEITGETPNLKDMVDTDKYKELIREIEESSVSEKEKKFLKLAASRHLVFNYKNIAEYYANVANEEMQELMEKSALVIIDFGDAIKYGYVSLMDGILKLEEEDDEA